MVDKTLSYMSDYRGKNKMEAGHTTDPKTKWKSLTLL